MKVLLVHPGASWSTADVEAGLRYGLEQHGVEVIRYRLDVRIERANSWYYFNHRRAVKAAVAKLGPGAPSEAVAAAKASVAKPTEQDVIYQASREAILTALYHQVDVVVVVSAMFLHPDVIIMMKRAGLRVVVLFTESPYDGDKELAVARLVDGLWTNERSSVAAFQAVNARAAYLPHGWHPERHRVGLQPGDVDVPAHDVVFVGTAFSERVQWLSSIDWTGIDLGLYGNWKTLSSTHRLRSFVREGVIDNERAAALYRRAAIGLNLYRSSIGWGRDAPRIDRAESMNPRGYELAACGAFHLSDDRAEVRELFGDLVPTFASPSAAAELIRKWLADPTGRASAEAQLPALVAESSWVHRARTVIGDLQVLLAGEKAA